MIAELSHCYRRFRVFRKLRLFKPLRPIDDLSIGVIYPELVETKAPVGCEVAEALI
jgi:hypothetical protein